MSLMLDVGEKLEGLRGKVPGGKMGQAEVESFMKKVAVVLLFVVIFLLSFLLFCCCCCNCCCFCCCYCYCFWCNTIGSAIVENKF